MSETATWSRPGPPAATTTSTKPPNGPFLAPSETTARGASRDLAPIHIGSAPDSWGVWFADDPEQTPADRFLREVTAAGFDWIELGPYGYLPSDPAELQDKLDEHGLRVSAGTVFSHLHRPDSWDAVWKQVTDVAALTKAVGGEHIVVIPDL